MGQSRTESLLETICNEVVGITYAICIYMWLGLGWEAILGLPLLFAALGSTRIFLIRRAFEWRRRSKYG
jgi:hypothetical protein